MMKRRILLALLLALGATGCSSTRETMRSLPTLDAVNRALADRTAAITLDDGSQVVQATEVVLSVAHIRYRTQQGGLQERPVTEVHRVGYHAEGSWWGLPIGAAPGLLLLAARREPCPRDSDNWTCDLEKQVGSVGGVVLAALGAIIGLGAASKMTRVTVYEGPVSRYF